MFQELDEFKQRVIYHALGADLYAGLETFDEAFRIAESNYRLGDIETLLIILNDPTLPDERLGPWRAYYAARRFILEWKPEKASAELEHLTNLSGDNLRLLQPRLLLLRGKIHTLNSEWKAAQASSSALTRFPRDQIAPYLLIEAYLIKARAAIAQSQTLGSWAIPWEGRGGRFLLWLMRLALLPLYLPLLIGLAIAGAGLFWKVALRHGADYSNWTIFRLYLDAFFALRQAKNLLYQTSGERENPDQRFQLEMLQLELLGKLEQNTVIEKYCLAWLEEPLNTNDPYQQAQIRLKLAEAQLKSRKPPAYDDIDSLIISASQIFTKWSDSRSIGRARVLRGQLALAQGQPRAALGEWQLALTTFHDPTGQKASDDAAIEGILGWCYRAIDTQLTESEYNLAENVITSAGKQIFFARLPNAAFRFLQSLAWIVPPFLALGICIYNMLVIQMGSRVNFRQLVNGIFSLQGLGYFLLALLAGMFLTTFLGLLGLIVSLLGPVARLEAYAITDRKLQILDSFGTVRTEIDWETVTDYVRVPRGLFFSRTGVLSRDILVTNKSTLIIPGTVSWPDQLSRAITKRSHSRTIMPPLYWYGGFPALFAGLLVPLAFLFSDSAFSPELSVSAQAWLCMASLAAAFLIGTGYTANAIFHYIMVSWQVTGSRLAILTAGLIGALLLVGVSITRNLLFPLAPYGIALGAILLLAIFQVLKFRPLGNLSTKTLFALQLSVVVVWLWLTGVTLGPILAHAHMYTYSGAIHSAARETDSDPAVTALYFEQMDKAARWMVALDSEYYQGYYAIGWAEFHRSKYTASIEAYTRAIQFTPMNGLIPPFYYCRALAYLAAGDDESASRDYQTYLDARPEGEIPACYDLFPKYSTKLPLE